MFKELKNISWSIGYFNKKDKFIRGNYVEWCFNKWDDEKIPDGEYPFEMNYTWWKPVPEEEKCPMIQYGTHPKYPNFTDMTIEGILKIKNGRVQHRHFDKQISPKWMKQNTHIWVEGMELREDGVVDIHLGS